MKGLIFCAFYYLLSVSYYVKGQDEENEINKDEKNDSKNYGLKRFVVENDFKPPIFGSYKYDPVKQLFIIDDAPMNVTETPTTEADITTLSTPAQPGLLFLRNGTTDKKSLRSKAKNFNPNKYTALNWKGNVAKFH